LLEREVLFQSDVEALIGKRPFEEKKPLADAVAAEAEAEKPTEEPSQTEPTDIPPANPPADQTA